jgi:N-methylhydantoinase B
MSDTDSPVQVNPITVEVLRNAFNSIAQEMNACLFRSAFSPIIYEMKDCSVGIFNTKGEVLGQSAGLPIFLGNLGICVQIIQEHFGAESLADGDIFIMNDSYLQGTHLSDMTVLAPVFFEGSLVGFSANRAHMEDIGGSRSGTTTEIYQEGLRIPPLRLARQGHLREGLLELFAANSRTPSAFLGDIHAQIAACHIGKRRLYELYTRFGAQQIEESAQEIFRQSERLDRANVAGIPNGDYHAEGYLDNDGIGSEHIRVKVLVRIDDERVIVDLSGSAPTARGCVNCGVAQTIAACRVAFKELINPSSPITGGNFRNLEVIVEPGTIFAAEEPAACAFYFSSLGLLIDLIARALAPAVADRVAAAHYGDSMPVGFHGRNPFTGAYFFAGEPTVGGWGASSTQDGESGLINAVNGDFKNIPTEFLERKFPVRTHLYGFKSDSEGAGRFRGGLGVTREYEALTDCFLHTWVERSVTRPWGLFTDEEATGPEVVVNPNTAREYRALKIANAPIKAGDTVRITTSGGGGFGDPKKRDAWRVRKDVENGYISPERAARVYGYEPDTDEKES